LPKKKSRATEKKDEEDQSGETDRNDCLTRLLIMAVGIIIIIAGGWDFRTGILGAALFLGPLFEAPEFRVLVKVTINRVSGKQVFQVQQSHISGSNVVGSAQEVHFHEAPQTVIQPPTLIPQAPSQAEEPDWEVDEEFTLAPDGYREFQFDLEEGDELVGSVEADEDVSCYVLGRLSVRSFQDGETSIPTGRMRTLQELRCRLFLKPEEPTSLSYIGVKTKMKMFRSR